MYFSGITIDAMPRIQKEMLVTKINVTIILCIFSGITIDAMPSIQKEMSVSNVTIILCIFSGITIDAMPRIQKETSVANLTVTFMQFFRNNHRRHAKNSKRDVSFGDEGW